MRFSIVKLVTFSFSFFLVSIFSFFYFVTFLSLVGQTGALVPVPQNVRYLDAPIPPASIPVNVSATYDDLQKLKGKIQAGSPIRICNGTSSDCAEFRDVGELEDAVRKAKDPRARHKRSAHHVVMLFSLGAMFLIGFYIAIFIYAKFGTCCPPK
ncbi:hypothetical protein PT974_11353 [Cladobotryum mycophilum]|uniref:Uncharacterized protein n=1 Tax=Cladobotryum mycophilum TaxID=491253 RepID=A0ABR0S5G6_9HYPO